MNKRSFLSLFLVIILVFTLTDGILPASAEDYVPELLPVAAEDGSLIDCAALTQFFDNYLEENYLTGEDQILSIALWYPGTDEYWYYNADEWMYGVNWYRLPVSMYLSEKVSRGELTMDTVVNGISLEYAVTTALESGSNPSSSSMVLYLGGDMTTNCADLTTGYANLPDSYFVPDYYQKNAYTARLMLEITKTLYLGGEERFPLVEESMKKAMPEDFFKRDWDVRHTWEIAQTHSAYWGDGAGDRINCTGIIYTPTPILLTVMMKNIADLDILGGVAWRVSHLAMAMDSRQHSVNTLTTTIIGSSEDAPAAVPTDPAPEAVTDQDAVAPSSNAPAPAGSVPSEADPVTAAVPEESAPSPSPESDLNKTVAPRSPFKLFLVIFLILFVVIVALAVWLILREQRQRRRRRRRRHSGNRH